MEIIEAADALNGSQLGSEGSAELFEKMANSGLVAVFGASDDLMEFRGAIYDEIGCYGGGTAHVDSNGLVVSDCREDDACPYYQRALRSATPIQAKWGDGGYSWSYETRLTHATFVVKEDDEKYCKGIVFRLADA